MTRETFQLLTHLYLNSVAAERIDVMFECLEIQLHLLQSLSKFSQLAGI